MTYSEIGFSYPNWLIKIILQPTTPWITNFVYLVGCSNIRDVYNQIHIGFCLFCEDITNPSYENPFNISRNVG